MAAPLSTEEKTALLRAAREALEIAVSGLAHRKDPLSKASPRLQEPGACFITLMKQNSLRGCIGTLTASRPLIEDVKQRAVDAALKDPRFPAVKPEEVPLLRIEVSVLSTPEPLTYRSPDEIPKRLQAGVDGVVLLKGQSRSTFLPQVWERVPDAETFLEMLCQKAGLGSLAWREGDVRILTYQVEKFCEPTTDA